MGKVYKINKTFHLKLTTLSPLAINSGEELSPLSDYYVSNGKVHYINGIKFLELLGSDDELTEKYSVAVDKTLINSADNFLVKLIPSEEKRKSISQFETLTYKGENTLLLKTVVKSNGNPYIPGSAIKGAIKNAVLYYWLTKISPTTIDVYIKENQKHFTEYIKLKPRFSEIKATTYRNRSIEERMEFKKIEKKERDILKSFESFSNDIQKKAFDIIDKTLRQPASNLKISDSESVSFSKHVEVSGIQRRSLRPEINDWTLHTQEYVKLGVEFNTILQISETEQDWKKFTTKVGLAKILQKSTDNIKPLFEILNHFANAVNDAQRVFKLDDPLSYYKPEANEGLLFLGSGKGIYKNTVLLAIREYYEKEAKDFKADFAPVIATIKPDFEDFPNSVSHLNNQPLGWIKITDTNKEAYKEKANKSYSEANLRSGEPIEAIFKKTEKPNSYVLIIIDGKEKELLVQGTKAFLKDKNNILQPDTKCIVYWRNNQLNFNK